MLEMVSKGFGRILHYGSNVTHPIFDFQPRKVFSFGRLGRAETDFDNVDAGLAIEDTSGHGH